MFVWRAREENNQLKKDADKAAKNIAIFLIFGSLTINLLFWLGISVVKFSGKSFQELVKINPLPSIVIGMGIATLYTWLVVQSYKKAMALFKGTHNEEVCAEEKKKAKQKISFCFPLCLLGWLITMAINYFRS